MRDPLELYIKIAAFSLSGLFILALVVVAHFVFGGTSQPTATRPEVPNEITHHYCAGRPLLEEGNVLQILKVHDWRQANVYCLKRNRGFGAIAFCMRAYRYDNERGIRLNIFSGTLKLQGAMQHVESEFKDFAPGHLVRFNTINPGGEWVWISYKKGECTP